MADGKRSRTENKVGVLETHRASSFTHWRPARDFKSESRDMVETCATKHKLSARVETTGGAVVAPLDDTLAITRRIEATKYRGA